MMHKDDISPGFRVYIAGVGYVRVGPLLKEGFMYTPVGGNSLERCLNLANVYETEEDFFLTNKTAEEIGRM